MKKLFSICLAVVLFIVTLQVNVSAGTYHSDEYDIYINDNGVAFIDKYKGNDTHVVIPSEYNGYTISAISSTAFTDNTTIQSVVIPETVTSILGSLLGLDGGAFSGCTALEEVTFLGEIEHMGGDAFRDTPFLAKQGGSTKYIEGWLVECDDNITTLKIKSGTKGISEYVCQDNTSLKSVTIPSSVKEIGSWAFAGCQNLSSIKWSEGLETIGWLSFGGCNSLVDVTIPSSVTTISSSAFSNCRNLKSINIPKKVDVICEDTFLGCWALETVTVEGNLETIEDSAFYSCEKLQNIKLPNSIKYIGGMAFNGCKMLSDLKVPKSVEYIGGNAFEETAFLKNQKSSIKYVANWVVDSEEDITVAKIKNGTVGISASAFSFRRYLKSVSIPDTVRYIGDSAFYANYSLTSVKLPNSVTEIGERAFDYCESLKSVTLSNSLTILPMGLFGYNESLESIVIPEGITKLDGRTTGWAPRGIFAGNVKLKTVYLPESLESIGPEVFDGCTALKNVYYAGTQEQWNKIKIAYTNEYLASAKINYNCKIPVSSLDKVNGAKVYSKTATSFKIKWNKDNSATGYIVEQYIDGKWTSYNILH